jgi:ABC-type transport system substrate-binding protein
MQINGILFIVLLFIHCELNIFFPTPVDANEKWEDKGSDWYYDNLTSEDRKNEIGKNMVGYDDSIQPREYNITKAKTLMTEVFNKTFSPKTEANDTVTKTPYFSMTIVSPTTSVYRTIYEDRVVESFQSIGIDVELKWWNWNIIIPRIYLGPIGKGLDYAHGGYDAFFIRKGASPDPDHSDRYFISDFTPPGNNALWIDNKEVTDIINSSLTEISAKDRLRALSEFQHWFYEEVPKSIVFQENAVFAMEINLEGFDPYLVGRGWCFNNYTIGNQTSMTYTLYNSFFDFNPLLSGNFFDYIPRRYYPLTSVRHTDSIPMRNVFGALAQRRGAYNLTHPVLQAASKWTSNKEGTIWEVSLRPNLKWSDGTNVTVDDVLYTYHSILDDATGSPIQGFFLDRFPNNASDIVKINDTAIRFNLGDFYPYVESRIFTAPIIQKTQWDAIDRARWKLSGLNTGKGLTYPIGFGPYKMTGVNLYYIQSAGIKIVTGVKLEINEKFDQNLFGHDPNAIGGGIYFTTPTIPTIYVNEVEDITTAIDGLKNGSYDILDSLTGQEAYDYYLSEANNSYNYKTTSTLDYNWHELSYNHYDPRWGMNAHDPRVLYRKYDYRPIINSPLILRFLLTSLIIGIVIGAVRIIQLAYRKMSEIP